VTGPARAGDTRDGDLGSPDLSSLVPDIATLRKGLEGAGYLTDEGLATALFCAVRMPQPILLEGEAGVGKTQAAKSLAQALGTRLIRLQCYDGIEAAEALYEWNYPRQLLAIRLAEAEGTHLRESDLFGPDYLVERPLLQAVRHEGPVPAVLLIDEVDRADEEFEAFLFELLAESAITIPEIGTVTADLPPLAVLTSNRTRDLHDALKRRCLYHWIDYPDVERAAEIIRIHVPSAAEELTTGVAGAVQRLRSLDLQKPPGVAEAIDWVGALTLLGVGGLDGDVVGSTLGSALKYREDLDLALDRGTGWVAGAD
jgi:MoxR-like ATPase